MHLLDNVAGLVSGDAPHYQVLFPVHEFGGESVAASGQLRTDVRNLQNYDYE